MKKVRIAFAVLFMTMIGFSINGYSQSTEEFFVGEWELLLKDTPMGGDMNSTMTIEKADNELSGNMTMGDASMGMTMEFTNVTIDGDKLIVTIDMMGQESKIEYTKMEDQSITGDLMGSAIEGTKKDN